MKKLSKREKVLIGVSIVGICAAGYFGYKCYRYKNKILEKDIDIRLALEGRGKMVERLNFLEENLELTTNELDVVFQDNKDNSEKLNFLKFLVIESGCIPKAKQNGNNKLAREEHKINGIIDAMVKHPNDDSLRSSLQKHEAEAKAIRYQLTNVDKMEDLINNDECIYAK